MPPTVKVAAVQASPVFLDAQATVDKAALLITQAGEAGAELILFPEAFVPTYPDWVWRLPAWSDSGFADKLRAEAVAIPGPLADRLGAAARDARAYVAIGVNEIEGGTLYNSLVYFGPDGAVVNVHRKLVATGGERTIWGMGDGSGLGVVTTPFGIVGGLICWENYMPLARAAMYAQGVDIYLAPTWDNSDTWLSTLRHIAKEGRCFVIGVSPVLRGSDVPKELRGEIYGGDDDWLSRGLATIVSPDGTVIVGPVVESEEIVYASLDIGAVRSSRHQFDVVGHYARPDILQLGVCSAPQRSVVFDEHHRFAQEQMNP